MLYQDSQLPDERSGQSAEAVGPATRIILAEDQASVRELYAVILSHAGYQVDVARDGVEAWKLLSSGTYELLITDNTMPNLTGIDLLRKLRRENTDLPAIMISGDMPWNEPDLRELVKPGGLLAKPFSPAPFLAAVEAA